MNILLPLAVAMASVATPDPADDVPLAPRVTAHYVTLAHERYDDSFDTANALLEAVSTFLRTPTDATHAAAKQAWVDAHTVYSHTEVFRFGNPNVDAWEGRVNAWPMDEGLIDYVTDDYVHHEGNPHARANLVVESMIPLTDEVIAEFMEGTDPKTAPVATVNMSDIEANVTRGYHVIEFLLWGQDTSATTGGRRPATDYARGDDCTNGRCSRRGDYLRAAARLLVQDLRFAVLDWTPDGRLYSKRFAALPVVEQLDRMLVGMGTMGFGELASERMQVALLSSDQEEEQSCFSDTTHLAIYHNARGIETLYHGRHARADGRVVDGPSLSELVARVDPALDAKLTERLAATSALAEEVVAAAEAGEPFDRMIGADNAEGRARLEALIGALREQTEAFEEVRAIVDRLAEV